MRRVALYLVGSLKSSKKRVLLFLVGIPFLKSILMIYRYKMIIKLVGFFSSKKYSYDPSHFSDTFLAEFSVNSQYSFNSEIPKQIFCFWTGANKMSQTRRKSLDYLIRNSGVKVELITPKNLKQFLKNDFPLHEGFQYLSLVHKSDYLRCYFMHHYGGGYSDIKQSTSSWQEPFSQIMKNHDKWIIGYREFGPKGVASVEGQLGVALKRNWFVLLSNGAYICKPCSPFTREWYRELHKRMDYYINNLRVNPGNIFGDNPGYPIPWSYILGQIFHPLCLKYHNHLLYSNKLRPISEDYR